MRTIIISILIAIILSSCTSVKHENEELKMKVDSLNNLSNLKDSAMNYFLKSMDEIDYNLQIIKEKENLITISSQNVNGELNQSQKDRINEDILMIYDLLQQNKEKLANMNHKFNQANIKIKEFKKTIEKLTKQLEKKDQEILSLRDDLIEMNIQIEIMTTQAEQLTAENENKDDIIDQKVNELNAAYYVFGSEKELKENNIITKEGGFIGLGKIEKLKDNFNKEYFTQIDITKTNSIQIFTKKAKIITSHPTESFKFFGEEKVDSLVINNPEEFWKVSKYLVIVID